MCLLANIDGRVSALNIKVDHLSVKHLEHEQTHEKYKEETREKMNNMNYKILEIRQLCGFVKNRNLALRGTPDGEESRVQEEVTKSVINKWMKVARVPKISQEILPAK